MIDDVRLFARAELAGGGLARVLFIFRQVDRRVGFDSVTQLILEGKIRA